MATEAWKAARRARRCSMGRRAMLRTLPRSVVLVEFGGAAGESLFAERVGETLILIRSVHEESDSFRDGAFLVEVAGSFPLSDRLAHVGIQEPDSVTIYALARFFV
jgi:hypothetical protein